MEPITPQVQHKLHAAQESTEFGRRWLADDIDLTAGADDVVPFLAVWALGLQDAVLAIARRVDELTDTAAGLGPAAQPHATNES